MLIFCWKKFLLLCKKKLLEYVVSYLMIYLVDWIMYYNFNLKVCLFWMKGYIGRWMDKGIVF